MTVSRRALLGLGLAAVGAGVAGCSTAVTRAAGSSGSAAVDRSTSPLGGPATTATPTTAAPTTAAPTAATSTSGTSTAAASPFPGSTAPGPSAGARHAVVPRGPADQVAHGPRTRREVALTFHGQGDPGIAHELLAIVAAHHASISVMAVGAWLRAYPALAHRIVAGGHELGNHTYHHLDIDSLGERAARAEIVRCRDLLVELVGAPGPHFRQSQSPVATPLVRRLAGEAGYRTCLSYDVDSLDWTDPGAAAVRANVRAARPGSIVSLHFGHPGTVQAMPGILTDLHERGLRPVTAATLLR